MFPTAQIKVQHKEQGVVLQKSAWQQANNTKQTYTQREIDVAVARGADLSENDEHKPFKEATRMVTDFNQRLKLAGLMSSAGATDPKLKEYLKHQGIDTMGGPVGECKK